MLVETYHQDGTVTVEEVFDLRPIPVQQSEALARLALVRWEKSQTFTYDGVETAAEPAINNVTAAVVAMQAAGDPTATVRWKLSSTEWRTFDFAALVAFGLAIRTYIQACFSREEELANQIVQATTPQELESIDLTSGW